MRSVKIPATGSNFSFSVFCFGFLVPGWLFLLQYLLTWGRNFVRLPCPAWKIEKVRIYFVFVYTVRLELLQVYLLWKFACVVHAWHTGQGRKWKMCKEVRTKGKQSNTNISEATIYLHRLNKYQYHTVPCSSFFHEGQKNNKNNKAKRVSCNFSTSLRRSVSSSAETFSPIFFPLFTSGKSAKSRFESACITYWWRGEVSLVGTFACNSQGILAHSVWTEHLRFWVPEIETKRKQAHIYHKLYSFGDEIPIFTLAEPSWIKNGSATWHNSLALFCLWTFCPLFLRLWPAVFVKKRPIPCILQHLSATRLGSWIQLISSAKKILFLIKPSYSKRLDIINETI